MITSWSNARKEFRRSGKMEFENDEINELNNNNNNPTNGNNPSNTAYHNHKQISYGSIQEDTPNMRPNIHHPSTSNSTSASSSAPHSPLLAATTSTSNDSSLYVHTSTGTDSPTSAQRYSLFSASSLSSLSIAKPLLGESLSLQAARIARQSSHNLYATEGSSDWKSFVHMLHSSPFLTSLLLFFPLGILAHYFQWSNGCRFFFNFLAIIPLAWLLGTATEELAMRSSNTIGGLLNASMGNAVELIVSVAALRRGYIKLVQSSLLGSILSNMLLVLGSSFFLGGLRYNVQHYNRQGAHIFAVMLLLASLALSIPSAYVNAFNAEVNLHEILMLSRITAAIIFIVYLFYLLFQLYTHADVFAEDSADEEELNSLSLHGALVLLIVVTLGVAISSDCLIDAIQPLTAEWNVSESFIGIIVLPIVGNAAEHATAVTVAMKNKMDLSIGVAIGSSTQIALFLIPFITLLGWIIHQPMTLDFTEFETIVLVMSVLIVNFLVKDGESNWLVGMLLLSSYCIIATAFYFHPYSSSDYVEKLVQRKANEALMHNT